MPLRNQQRTKSKRWRRSLLHGYRWLVLLSLLWLIHDQHQQFLRQQQPYGRPDIPLDVVRRFYPEATTLLPSQSGRGALTVQSGQGDALGFVVQTTPESDQITGYSGSTNTLIAFDLEQGILGIHVLSSGDTPDHLAAVVTDESFMTAFNGLSWDQAARQSDVEGVSGATLTSLAMVQGIASRLGGESHSLRFPESITIDEVQAFWPQAVELVDRPDKVTVALALDGSGEPLGYLTRTSPTADDTIGFQGPTDTLLALDLNEQVVGLAVRSSYETPEYVGWVRDDRYFMTLFNGKSIDQLASLDLWEARVEGVSGATMTSMNVAETLVATARRVRDERPPPKRAVVTVAARDLGTAMMVSFALLMAFTRLKRQRWIRTVFQVLLVAYLGFVNGDMLSQALIVGWTQGRIPWQSAPGLVMLCGVALTAPLLFQRPVYCLHLCPHGAVQHLVAGRLPWRLRLPRWLDRCLKPLPAVLLAVVVTAAMLHWNIHLAALEPFDAYVFRVAGWSSIIIALTGLMASLFVPMAYCRYGCPTGGLLEFLRLKGRADHWSRADGAALAILAAAATIRVLSGT